MTDGLQVYVVRCTATVGDLEVGAREAVSVTAWRSCVDRGERLAMVVRRLEWQMRTLGVPPEDCTWVCTTHGGEDEEVAAA